MKLRDQKVLVVGLARSGIAAARFCHDRGAKVTVNDHRAEAQLAAPVAELGGRAIARAFGGHPAALFLAQDLIVLSPGVPPHLEGLVAARAANVPIISEIELAGRFLPSPVTAITGTNGKTTTASMVGDVFQRAGKKTFLGGNIGDPLVHGVDGGYEAIVAEVSSFQLETTQSFAPDVGIYLNLSPDHLDRYASLEAYSAAKERLFAFQRPEQHALLNADDAFVAPIAQRLRSHAWLFSATRPLPSGGFLDGDTIVLRLGDGEERFDARARQLLGRHNLSNLLVMAMAARLCKLPRTAIEDCIAHFQAPPHRLELVRTWHGVRYFNDSKATNVDSVLRSLESVPPPIRLIAGGRHKGAAYTPMRELVRQNVAALYLIGEAGELLAQDLGDAVPCIPCGDLPTAVARAASDAQHGDAVLLSPACSSYDQFQDYEERGARFRALVEALP